MLNDKQGKNFIPVAEEYIRKGLLDQAIDLLKEGIDRYPSYLSARVSLGKAYAEKGMIGEAMQEFEYVIRISPDNILAHRRLAFLYKDAGMKDSAVRSCEAVLIVNSRDREISDLLSTLKSDSIEKSSSGAGRDGHKTYSAAGHPGSAIDFTSGWEVASDESQPAGLSGEFLTESMGDICIAQGEKSRGIDIYKKILQKDPGNESVRNKLIASGELRPSHMEQMERLEGLLNRVRTNRI